MKNKVIVIQGPTASGKTSFGIELAKKINGEIISADSMQIYKEMDIGTAKVTQEEMQGIPHYLIDFVDPNERFSVAQFQKFAFDAIKRIIEKGKTPIIVGGTGLYIDSIIKEVKFLEIEEDLNYRKFLKEISNQMGLEYLYKKAKQIDPVSTTRISPQDEKRIFRILEIFNSTNKTKSQIEEQSLPQELTYDYLVYTLCLERQMLYDRINMRVDKMIEDGLIDEVRHFYEKYKNIPTSNQALGYKEVKLFLDNEITYEQMVDMVKKETRHYAKRQITWFKKNKNAKLLDPTKDITYNINEIIGDLKT